MTPAYRIEIDGKDITTEWGKRLTSLSITDEAGIKSDTLEVEFDGRDKIKAPKVGAKIKVWLGYEPAPILRGQFVIDEWALSGPLRTLSISAKAAELTSTIRAAKTRRTFLTARKPPPPQVPTTKPRWPRVRRPPPPRTLRTRYAARWLASARLSP